MIKLNVDHNETHLQNHAIFLRDWLRLAVCADIYSVHSVENISTNNNLHTLVQDSNVLG